MTSPVFSPDDHRFMARAVQLAQRGLFTTDPNPRVGCVIVRDGVLLGEGWHERAGEPHAEINALGAIKGDAQGATVYVTLEPCGHFGRTPPCADALVDAKVARVVIAMQDPNPLVAGRGIARLAEAGIAVEVGLMAEAAAELNPGFIKRMRSGRPFVRVKMASSLDGRTAMASGESAWITSVEARQDVQRWRARSSVVLTGVDTVIMDDPSLDVRLDALAGRLQPIRVILDSQLRTPPGAKTLGLQGEVHIYHLDTASSDRRSALQAVGAKLHSQSAGRAGQMRLDLHAVLSDLATQGINEIHVEAGATVCGALMQQQLVDEMVIYLAPHLMGDGGRGLFHMPVMQKMAQRLPLRIKDIRAVGADWRIIAHPENEVS